MVIQNKTFCFFLKDTEFCGFKNRMFGLALFLNFTKIYLSKQISNDIKI